MLLLSQPLLSHNCILFNCEMNVLRKRNFKTREGVTFRWTEDQAWQIVFPESKFEIAIRNDPDAPQLVYDRKAGDLTSLGKAVIFFVCPCSHEDADRLAEVMSADLLTVSSMDNVR